MTTYGNTEGTTKFTFLATLPNGFKPKASERKLLTSYGAKAVYVYKDGIVLWHEKEVGKGKHKAKVEVWHIWPCATHLHSYDHATRAQEGETEPYRAKAQKARRLVFHDPNQLAGGLSRIEVNYGNNSGNSTSAGYPRVTSIALTQTCGARFSMHNHLPFSSRVTVQPDEDDTSAYGGWNEKPEDIEDSVLHYWGFDALTRLRSHSHLREVYIDWHGIEPVEVPIDCDLRNTALATAWAHTDTSLALRLDYGIYLKPEPTNGDGQPQPMPPSIWEVLPRDTALAEAIAVGDRVAVEVTGRGDAPTKPGEGLILTYALDENSAPWPKS